MRTCFIVTHVGHMTSHVSDTWQVHAKGDKSINGRQFGGEIQPRNGRNKERRKERKRGKKEERKKKIKREKKEKKTGHSSYDLQCFDGRNSLD